MSNTTQTYEITVRLTNGVREMHEGCNEPSEVADGAIGFTNGSGVDHVYSLMNIYGMIIKTEDLD